MTAISTTIATAISAGANAISNLIPNIGAMTASEMTASVHTTLFAQFAQSTIATQIAQGAAIVATGVAKLTLSILMETYEELMIDPWIEAYVSKSVRDMGGSRYQQIFWSSLAESGRKTGLSMVTQSMGAMAVRSQLQASQNLDITSQSYRTDVAQMNADLKAQKSESLARKVGGALFSSVLLYSGIFLGASFGSAGAEVGNMMLAFGITTHTGGKIKDSIEATLKAKRQQIPEPINIHSRVSDAWISRIVREIEEENVGTSALSIDQKIEHNQEQLESILIRTHELYTAKIGGIYNLPRPEFDIMEAREAARLREEASRLEDQKRRDSLRSLLSTLESDIKSVSDSERDDIALVYINKVVERCRNLDFYGKDIVKSIVDNALKVVNELKQSRKLPSFYPSNKDSVKISPDPSEMAKFNQLYDENSWGGVMYEITVNLPWTSFDHTVYDSVGEFIGDTYFGATGRLGMNRFIEHVQDAIRDFEKVVENYRNGKKFHKLKFAIINSLFAYGYSWENLKSISHDMDSKKKADKVLFAEEFAKELLDSNIINFRPIELTESYEYAFEREKEIVKNLWSDDKNSRMILNNIVPTGSSGGASLPFYDIAFLTAVGFSLRQVYEIITKEFGISIGYDTLQRHFSRVFGSFSSAQERLVKPVIDFIIDKLPSNFPNVPSGITLANAIRDIGETASTGWFSKWLTGDFLLDTDFKKIWGNIDKKAGRGTLNTIKEKINLYYKRYYGAPWKQWESWLIKGMTSIEIAKTLNVPSSMVNNLFYKKGVTSSEVRKVARKRVLIDLLAIGIAPRVIYKKTFGYSSARINTKEMRETFESLFGNAMTYDEIIAHDWTSQVGGWIEFYGLVRGRDY